MDSGYCSFEESMLGMESLLYHLHLGTSKVMEANKIFKILSRIYKISAMPKFLGFSPISQVHGKNTFIYLNFLII